MRHETALDKARAVYRQSAMRILRHGPLTWGSKSAPMMLWESWLPRPNRREGTLECSRDFRFERPLEVFGSTVEAALDEARRCITEGGARLHDMPVAELRLSGVEASFDERGDVAEGLGTLRFKAELR